MLKIVVLLALSTSCFLSSAQQTLAPTKGSTITFSKGTELPYPLVYQAYTHDERYVYAVNGLISGNVYSTQLLKYDVAANTKWSVVTDQLTPKIRGVAAYVPSTGKIYIMGGRLRDRLGLFNGVEVVDVHTGAVTILKVANPMPAVDCGVAVYENKIYLFGGSEGQSGEIIATNKVYEFDTTTETFKRLANLPQSIITAGAVVNGALYTFGGYDRYTNYFITTNIYAYNIAGNTWKTVAKLPQKLLATAVIAWGNKIYLAGSFPDQKFFGYFDTATHVFIKIKSNITGRRYAGAGIIGGKLCVYGGTLNESFPGLTSVQVADLSIVN
jgi:N-acetylneuraminic acid mutarotase